MVCRVALTVLVAANACSASCRADSSAPFPPLEKDAPAGSTPRDALLLAEATPETFVIELDHDRRAEIDALALFHEDRFDCHDRLLVDACEIRGRSRIALGSRAFVTLLVGRSWEHEGRSYSEESVAIATVSPKAKVVHTLMQWNSKMEDSDSTVRIRRWAAGQAKDGRDLLCIESVEEKGVGLFDIMHDTDAGRSWRPYERTRSIEAFVWGAEQGALVRSPDDQAVCPTRGYSQLVPNASRSTPFDARIDVQGDVVSGRWRVAD